MGRKFNGVKGKNNGGEKRNPEIKMSRGDAYPLKEVKKNLYGVGGIFADLKGVGNG